MIYFCSIQWWTILLSLWMYMYIYIDIYRYMYYHFQKEDGLIVNQMALVIKPCTYHQNSVPVIIENIYLKNYFFSNRLLSYVSKPHTQSVQTERCCSQVMEDSIPSLPRWYLFVIYVHEVAWSCRLRKVQHSNSKPLSNFTSFAFETVDSLWSTSLGI